MGSSTAKQGLRRAARVALLACVVAFGQARADEAAAPQTASGPEVTNRPEPEKADEPGSAAPVGAPEAPAAPVEKQGELKAGDSAKKAEPLTEAEKIEHLLRYIESSETVFIRNDEEHSPKVAADHMRNKLKLAGNRLSTARDFIEYLASKSSNTGRPYKVRFKDGTEVKSGDWLLEELGRLEAEDAKKSGEGQTPPPLE